MSNEKLIQAIESLEYSVDALKNSVDQISDQLGTLGNQNNEELVAYLKNILNQLEYIEGNTSS